MSEQRIAEVFVELADTLVDEFDVVDFLHVLTDRCVELLAVDASGLMLADERGRLQVVAGTSRVTRDLELFELEVDEGPCVETLRDGRRSSTWTSPQPGTAGRGSAGRPRRPGSPPPRPADAAARAGHRGAEPLLPHDHERHGLALGQAMADIATIGLINERSLREKTVLSEQLQNALQSRIVIEQAKGVLAPRSGIGVADAFIRLRRHARRTGTPLTLVADAVITGELRLDLPRAR